MFTAFGLILFNTCTGREQLTKVLLYAIPILGTGLMLTASCGIVAAVAVARQLENERSGYQRVLREAFGVEIPDLGAGRSGAWVMRWSRVLGTAPFFLIMGMLVLMWIGALLMVTIMM